MNEKGKVPYRMETPKFQRCQEDFVCDHCGRQVRGNGYTDHCPHCLWSVHVDNSPGDLANPCRGPLEPVQVEFGQPSKVYYECCNCGARRKVHAAHNDSFEVMLDIAKKATTTFFNC